MMTLDRGIVERLVRDALTKKFPDAHSRKAAGSEPGKVVVNVSARHAHVTQEDLERLFGKGHQLKPAKWLYQDGFFAAEETITLVGPRQRIIPNVRILGPCRDHSQVELAFTDAVALGLDIPVRKSGDIKNSPGCWIMGPAGMIHLEQGVIRHERHVHMGPADLARYGVKDGDTFFDAAQNARIVRAAEQYYRIMYQGSRESWNLRDRHMFETLQRLMQYRPKAKAIVWAHNSHIGNAAATSMGWEGEFNIGELCRTAYGEAAIAIGFGTDRGTVVAASDWDTPMEVKAVRPARSDSYEFLLRHAGHVRSLTDWRSPARADLRDLLSLPRLERAIGVVYRPDTELLSHYFRAVLSEQFDAYVWFETTRAVTPLGPERPKGTPESYPFGL